MSEGMIQRSNQGVRTATVVVAAADSLHPEQADYVCPGINDEVMIQTVLDVAGDIYFMDGTYNKNNATPIDVLSNTTIHFADKANIRLGNNAGNNAMLFRLNSVENIKMFGGILDGNKAGQTVSTGTEFAIQCIGANRCTFAGIDIKNVGSADALSGYGLYFNASSNNKVYGCISEGNNRENIVCFNESNGNIITNNHFLDAEDRHIVVHTAHDNIIKNNILRTSGGRGIDVHSSAERNLIEANKIFDATGRGISIEACCYNHVTRNTIKDCLDQGIYVSGTSENNDVNNNHIINNSLEAIITSASAHNNIFNDNTIRSPQTYGMRIESTENQVCGNKVFDGGDHGIWSLAGYNTIARNKVINCNKSGIMLSLLATYNLVDQNILNENGGGGGGQDNGITLSGASVANNIITRNRGRSGASQQYGIRIHATVPTSNTIIDNDVRGMGATLDLADHTGMDIIRNNLGYVTEASGTDTILSAATHKDVTHGLAVTPTAKDISVTPAESLRNASEYWIDTIGSSTFRINVDVNPGTGTVLFAWSAIVL